MKKELREYWIKKMHRGIQLDCGVCAYTKKDAAKMLDVSVYYLNNYCSGFPARAEIGIKNPLLRLARFERSGEQGYFIPPELIDKPIKYIEAISIIDEHRKLCGSYQETLKRYPQGKYRK